LLVLFGLILMDAAGTNNDQRPKGRRKGMDEGGIALSFSLSLSLSLFSMTASESMPAWHLKYYQPEEV
jgi:hypothetical protein